MDQPTSEGPTPSTCVASLMSRCVYCVREDVPVPVIEDLLLDRGYSSVPVVDANGHARGIVTKTDLLRHCHADGPDTATASDVMMPLVFVVDQRTSIGDAAALMATEDIHRVPVTDHGGSIVGILSALDLVRWLGQVAGYAV